MTSVVHLVSLVLEMQNHTCMEIVVVFAVGVDVTNRQADYTLQSRGLRQMVGRGRDVIGLPYNTLVRTHRQA
jgi:hypothetical protein